MKLGMASMCSKMFIYLFTLPQISVMAHRIFVVSRRIFCCSAWTDAWLWCLGSVVAHRLSCSKTCGILDTGQ